MRRALTVLIPLAVVLALAIWRAQGPAPRPSSTPESEFAAARAMPVLRALVGDGTPHPVGTAANRRLRRDIEERFRVLGYDVTVQRRFACNAAAACAEVENILARHRGVTGGDLVLLLAHYDSVPAGPGASDDAMGVAALLEVARAIRAEEFRNRVAFLITDGEEAGLLGAEAFVADEELSRDVAAVVNVEMRGTYGPSTMFETSRENRWLIRHLAAALERPQASSLFYEIYNLLPNDTDVTVFKRAGKAAVNFGGVRGVNWYHTPLDDFAHASPRTMQHHGENLLASVRALANADLAARSRSDATYFDLLGFVLVWWPQEWTLPMVVVSLLLLVFAARQTQPRAMTLGVLAAFAAILFAVLVGAAASTIIRMNAPDANFVARPFASVAAMWLVGVTASLAGATIFSRRDDPRAMLLGVAIVWHMIGIAVTVAVPGAAFLFVVPAVTVTVCALARANETAMGAVAATAAGILMIPLGVTLYDALGSRLMSVIAVIIAMAATLAAPLFARWRNAAVAAALAIIAVVAALLQPVWDEARPRHIQLSYVDDPAARAPLWLATAATENLKNVARFASVDPDIALSRAECAAPAPRLAVPRIRLTAERQGDRVTVRAQSLRAANRLSLLVRGGAVRRVNGITPPPRPPRFRERLPRGWSSAAVNGMAEMTVEIEAKGPIELIASDATWGLPAEGQTLQQARDASTATTMQDGDATITRARLRL